MWVTQCAVRTHGQLTRGGMMIELRYVGAITVILLFASTEASLCAQPQDDRPESWAQPIELEGVPNLFKVSDTLYRSAQPTAEGMRNLRKLGIVTIVNLRSFHSDRSKIGTTRLGYEHIYMKHWHPERKEVVRFLQIVTDPKQTPVLVHCWHGSDRTGMMVAMYRIAVQGWSKDEAIREMKTGGFGFNRVWDNLAEWVRDLDMDSIRKEAGIEGAPQ